MKRSLLFPIVLAALSFPALAACDKPGGETGSVTSTAASTVAPAVAPVAATKDVACQDVVEKIAALNPPDARGEPEKKLWRKMCAEFNAAEKTCVMGAKAMSDMAGCMKR